MNADIDATDSTTKLEPVGQVSLVSHIRDFAPARQENRLKSALNPLLSAAYPLFHYVSRLQLFPQDLEPGSVQQQLCAALVEFEHQAQKHVLREEHIALARYFLCALLDDVLEHSANLQGINWLPHSLLNLYYQETLIDHRLYKIIDHLQEQPAVNLHLLEMAYMILVYGYQGIYRQELHGSQLILEKIDELYHLIRWQHGDFRKNLFMTLSS